MSQNAPTPAKVQAAALILSMVPGYDKTVVQPVLQDWAEGKDFRRQDRHRVVILQDYLHEMRNQASLPEGFHEAFIALEPALTEYLARVSVADSLRL